MLQHEFENLTGLKITMDQYEVINGMYMCDDNQTKQEFCKSFMEMGLMSHVNYVVKLKAEEAELRKDNFELKSQRDMWRDCYCNAKEQAAVMEATIKMSNGGSQRLGGITESTMAGQRVL